MTRRDALIALTCFVVAACASGVAPDWMPTPVTEDAGTVIDASVPSDGGPSDAGDGSVSAGGDSLPVDALVITQGACPSGYTMLPEADGRYLLGATTGIGTTSSATPLSSQEDRTHQHTISANAVTRNIGFAGSTLTGGNNHAVPDDPLVNATTGGTSLGLPYLQTRVCRKTAAANPTAPALAAGMVVPFVASACPAGFAPYTPADGRFVAGTVAGTNEASFGGAAMTSGESFSHQHTYSGSISLPKITVCLAGGGADFSDEGLHEFTLPVMSVSTTLPFVRVLYCEKM